MGNMYRTDRPLLNVEGFKELQLGRVVFCIDNQSHEPAIGFLSIGCSGDKHELAADKIRAEGVAALFTCLKIMMV